MSKKYEVTGPQPVYGHKTGEVVALELDDAQEKRLIAAGHIKPAAKAAPNTKKES